MMKKLILYCIAGLVGIALPSETASAQPGTTTIARWKDNKQGAFSLRFDDSMWSHHDNAVPTLARRGLTGTFFINPGVERYGYGIQTWESLAGRTGMELCPHTMNHMGASDFEEAEYEIGTSFRIVWELNPPRKSPLYPFHIGGGTTWPSGFREAVLSHYPAASYEQESVRYSGPDDRNALIRFARKAMDEGMWHVILTHGTGPHLEYLGFEDAHFEALLDYLASVKDKLWIGNIGDVYKYIAARKTAQASTMENSDSVIRIALTSDADPMLYDFPLTLITEVPTAWRYCHVAQGTRQGIYPVNSGLVKYEALPGLGDIVLKSSAMDTTPPSAPTVRDGSGGDVAFSPHTHRVSANWDESVDAESGISRYWYKIGTTPGGSEVLDWIDNGLQRAFSTSRTNLSLIRGRTYFVTVKAVNGVGLSSESTSDGFTVMSTPDYRAFQEDFDNGYLSQWHEKRTKTGFMMGMLHISDEAARKGRYGLRCHLPEGSAGQLFIARDEVTRFDDVFTRFYFKLHRDFVLPEDGAALQILELRNAAGEFVAGVHLGHIKGLGLHIYATATDDNGYRTAIPGVSKNYPEGWVPVAVDQWHRVDLRTDAHDGKGGAEFWLNGERKGCITNKVTGRMRVSRLMLGALNIPVAGMAGDLYFDNITVSDSLLE